jgi:hypothetical protein
MNTRGWVACPNGGTPRLRLETLLHSTRFSGVYRGSCKTRYMNALGYVGAIISIVAGFLGLIWPQQVSRKIGLQIPGRLGTSEVRATYGGLFVGAGTAVALIGNSDAALVLGAAWAGAFTARAISFVIDTSRSKENIAGLFIEGLMASLLILA